MEQGTHLMSKALTADEAAEREAAHRAKLDPVVSAHLRRKARGEKHPVMDFLFEYYPFAPARLMRWSPGWGVAIRGGAGETGWRLIREGRLEGEVWSLDRAAFPDRRLEALRWTVSLLDRVAARPPRFGCYGLHEWAMVYRAPEVRHGQLPLRLTAAERERVVEQVPVVCSHYDAFRFFTEAARPLNRLQPRLETRGELEQAGCLHVNMDLYKWAMQWHPWVAGELVAEVFALACAIREWDMRASPYDVTSLGLEPVRIETEAGRADYAAQQAVFCQQAEPLRRRLTDTLRGLATWAAG
jgi:hypothetical protein